MCRSTRVVDHSHTARQWHYWMPLALAAWPWSKLSVGGRRNPNPWDRPIVAQSNRSSLKKMRYGRYNPSLRNVGSTRAAAQNEAIKVLLRAASFFLCHIPDFLQPLPRAKPPPSKRIIPQGTRLSTAFQVIKGSADGLNFRKLVSPGRAKSTIEIKMAGVASSIPRKKGGREKKRDHGGRLRVLAS